MGIPARIYEHKINLENSETEELIQFITFISKLLVGDIVYMGPVTLNKDSSINRAGIEVNVIPIMKSPCPSPQPKKQTIYRRPHSELGFRRDRLDQDDNSSLPDLKRSPQKGSLLDTILKMNPDTFLSNESLNNDSKFSRSSYAASKGSIMNAVADWLQKTSPFGSIEQIDQRSLATSFADMTDTSISLFDDDDLEDSSHEKSFSKSDYAVPEIFVLPDESSTLSPARKHRNKSKTSSNLGK